MLRGSNEAILRRMLDADRAFHRRLYAGRPAGHDAEQWRVDGKEFSDTVEACWAEIERRLGMSPAERDAELDALPVRWPTVADVGVW